MKYNFDEIIPRRGTDSLKWDGCDDPEMLPMWIADMDFKAAPCIIEALKKRVEHGVFGYTKVPDSYYESVSNWFSRRHGWKISKEQIIYTIGVVPAVCAIVKSVSKPGDKILLQTPAYNCFFPAIRNNDCEILCSPLKAVGNTFEMDYEDIDRKLADPMVKAMVLCNPHNPVGRVWSREELIKVGELCLKHNVLLVSDEIHCEVVMPGYKYTPFASISEEFAQHSVSCVSPSKGFNMGGIQIANIVSANKDILAKINDAVHRNEVCSVADFGVVALQAAYNEGEDYLDQLIDYLHENYEFCKKYCEKNLPQFPLTKLEGTYLVWMNCKALGMTSEQFSDRLCKEAKLWLNAGTMYGEAGEGFMRWNIACPRSVLADGLERFRKFVFNVLR